MKKIIFIYPTPFTLRDYHRLGAEYLTDKGYHVEIWRVNNGLTKKIDMNVSAGLYQGKNLFDFSTLEFIRHVKKKRNAIFILPEYKNIIYMYAMAKYHCNYFLIAGTGKILISEAYIPKTTNKSRYNISYCIKMMKSILQQIRQSTSMNMAEKYFLKCLPSYVFLGVPVTDKWLDYVPIERRIYIHSFDYDRYLETGEYAGNSDGECIVYIDSGFGNVDIDGELGIVNDPWYGKGEKIWSKLEAVFDKLEQHYHLPIVVAGHPHTKYEDDFLCKRKIIYNKTQELVAKSRFVIMQWSTSVSFALLYKKDILVLVDDDLKKFTEWYNWWLPSYKYFGITPCNMDKREMSMMPWKYVHKIDEKVAQQYINEYIKMPGTPNKLFVEVMEEKIKKMGKEEVKKC